MLLKLIQKLEKELTVLPTASLISYKRVRSTHSVNFHEFKVIQKNVGYKVDNYIWIIFPTKNTWLSYYQPSNQKTYHLLEWEEGEKYSE